MPFLVMVLAQAKKAPAHATTFTSKQSHPTKVQHKKIQRLTLGRGIKREERRRMRGGERKGKGERPEMHQNRSVVPDPKWTATLNGSRESGCIGNGDGCKDFKGWEVALKLRARSFPCACWCFPKPLPPK